MARMMSCPHCGHSNYAKNVICDTCGRKLHSRKKKKPTTFDDNIIDKQDKKTVNKQFDFDFGDYQLKKNYNIVLNVILFILGFWPGVIYLFFSFEKKE